MTTPEEQAAEVLCRFLHPAQWQQPSSAYMQPLNPCTTCQAASAALAPLFAEERRKAWGEGARRGYTLYDMRFEYVECANPYRERADTYAEGDDDRG